MTQQDSSGTSYTPVVGSTNTPPPANAEINIHKPDGTQVKGYFDGKLAQESK